MSPDAGASDAPVLDVIGVGVGPFNLGLAALLEPLGLRTAFFEAKPAFSWHPGLMLPDAALQVPFLADLVTLADPTSRHSFLNYLHEHDRLYRFYFYERFHVPRREYEDYCRWVADRVGSVHFAHRVVELARAGDGTWCVRVAGPDGAVVEHRAGAVVVGVGTTASVPAFAQPHLGTHVFHSGAYLHHREAARTARAVTVVGSGQSAGEVVADLLDTAPQVRVDWLTRSDGFLPMEYTKLGLEHFTPDYATWFHGLPQEVRDEVRRSQGLLYRGLSPATSARIYDRLYERSIGGVEPDVHYRAGCELRALAPNPDGPHRWRLSFQHRHADRAFELGADVVVLATGYRTTPLPLADPALVARDGQDRPVIEADHRVRLADGTASTLFVQHADLHSHGVGAPDLGLAARRNAVIANAVAGRPVYRLPARTAFQRFGPPEPGGDPGEGGPGGR